VVDVPGAVPLKVGRGDIRFEQVSFAYGATGDSVKPVIDRLSMHIAAGEKIGLVGRSGAGKSTLVNLLLRFYDVASGRVLINGQDIALVTQDSLRAQVGMVTQDTSLLHRSVRENILYGRPDADDAAMVTAARRAEAHEFILGLSDRAGRTGYDAHVGERGVKLSGGQRQRVSIARAILANPRILILDEATSSLDSESEAAIQEGLSYLMKGRTTFVIAHRLSTIRRAEQILVVEAGRIVERGTHESLYAQHGRYWDLYTRQHGVDSNLFLAPGEGDKVPEPETKPGRMAGAAPPSPASFLRGGTA
jgi:ATP-binding cassette subfamily B multidrug efflux pump